MKRFKKIIGEFQKIISKLDKLKAKADRKAVKYAAKANKFNTYRIDQIKEGMLAKTASDNLKEIFPQPKK